MTETALALLSWGSESREGDRPCPQTGMTQSVQGWDLGAQAGVRKLRKDAGVSRVQEGFLEEEITELEP